jgi:hypothetical protein
VLPTFLLITFFKDIEKGDLLAFVFNKIIFKNKKIMKINKNIILNKNIEIMSTKMF